MQRFTQLELKWTCKSEVFFSLYRSSLLKLVPSGRTDTHTAHRVLTQMFDNYRLCLPPQ